MAATYAIRALDGDIYRPNPGQAEFFRALNDPAIKYVWYAGGMGAGKTLTGAVALALEMLRRPRGVFIAARQTYRELLTTSWDCLVRILPKGVIVARFESPSNMMMVLRNGTTLYGWNLSNWKNLTSLNIDGFWVDEVHEIPDPAPWYQLCARLRGAKGPLKGWATGTPGGRDWAYQLFFEQGLDDHALIRAKTRDNLQHLPPGYEAGLRRIYPPEMAARFLDAEFTEWEGRVLHAFREDLHTIEEFAIPKNWNRYRGIDPGFGQNPAACLWGATDEEGNLFLTDEWQEEDCVVSKQAERIHKITAGHPVEWSVIDPAARKRNDETGVSTMELYQRYDLPVEPADNRMDAGVMLLNNLLAPDPERLHPLEDRAGAPSLYFFRRGTAQLREQIRNWLWDGKRPATKNKHLIDCLRYMAMRKPQPSYLAAKRPAEGTWKQFWEGVGREATEPAIPLIGAA